MSLTFSGGPDYIDSQQQDQTVIYRNAALPNGPQTVIATFNCAQLSHISVNVISNALNLATLGYLQADFSTDPLFGTYVVGSTFLFRGTQLQFNQFIPMASLYCRLTWTPVNGPNTDTWNVLILADTKGDNVGMWNRGRIVTAQQVSVGGGLTVATQCLPTAGGNASLWFRWTGVAYTITGTFYNETWATSEFFQYSNSVAPGNKPISMVWPKGPTYITVISGDGAGQIMNLSVVMA